MPGPSGVQQGVLRGAETGAAESGRGLRQAPDGMKEVGSHFKQALDQSIADQPMATLALAAAVGFLLGALWKA